MTLVELLIVLFILGILLSAAVPGYLSFKDRSTKSAAKAGIRAVLPGVQAYGQDNSPGSNSDPDAGVSTSDSGFENMTPALIKSTYAPSLDVAKYFFTGLNAATYCIYTYAGVWTAYKNGPSASVGVTYSSSFNPATCS
jgi:prepilin-type N-terminal cleavage/methylation domain-containing protein